MKKNYKFLFPNEMRSKNKGFKAGPSWLMIFALFAFLFTGTLFAQEGETCDDPIVISAFPFDDSGYTGNYGNNYSNTDVPPVADNAVTDGSGSNYYLGAAEAVYAFTPIEDGTVDISITNDDGWTSLWVFTGCPFSSTVGYHTATSGGDRSVEGLPVEDGETYYIVISDWDDSINYTIEVTSSVALEGQEACTEAIAGTIEGNDMACAGINFTLTTEGSTSGASGLTKQWQSSQDGENWEDIEGAQGSNLTTNITESTYFRFSISCEEGETDTSEAFLVGIKPAIECYCIPEGTNPSYYINNFSTSGGIQNIENLDTGYDENGYGDYTETHTVSQVHTESIEFSAEYASPNTFGTKIWVDWNQDGTFSEDEVVYQSSTYSSSSSGSFEVPESAALGETRMRIGISYTPNTGPNSPCESGAREFEDYTFEVLPLDDCEGTPTAGTVESEMEVCAGTAFTLSTEGSSDPAAGLDRIWQFSPAGEDNWTDIEGSNSADFTLTDGISEDLDFRYKVVCNNSDESDISGVIEVSLKPADECYCIPEGTNSSYYINNFSTTGGIQNIENLETGFAPNGYGDYTETHTVSQVHTESIEFNADYAAGNTFGTKIWVDWNQDGQFSDDEIVYQSSTYTTSVSGAFEVPEFAALGETRMRIGISYTPITGPDSPCESGSREFEDYTFEVLPLDDCEGTPTAGTVETEMEVCIGTAFTLSTEGSSDPAAGLDRIWQSSPAGENDWTDVDGSNSPEFTIEDGVFEDTDFRYKLVCNNSDETVVSDVIEVTLKPGNECYCEPPAPTYSDTYWIDSVNTDNAIEDISNNSTGMSDGGYADYFDTHTVMVEPGGTFDIEVKAQTGASPGLKIWIDWNQNGSFDDEGDLVYETTSGSTSSLNTYTVTIDVPSDAEGVTRMRIRNYIGTEPCNLVSYGETEDYSVEMVELDGCTEAIAGTFSISDTEVCQEGTVTLSVEGNSGAAEGLIRTWQSSPAGEDDWTDLGSSSANYDVVVTENTDFRYYVSCSYSDESDISNVIGVTLKPAEECYCVPEGTTPNRFINNFSTSNGFENISNLNSGFSTGGYGDFTDMTVSQINTQEVSFETDISGGTAGFRIWIDWNQDGIFSSDEVVYQSSSYAESHNGSFTVPENAPEGETTMRIVSHWLSTSGDVDPCATGFTYGEFEDYTFEVVNPTCYPATNIAIDYITDNSAQVTWDANDESAWILYYGEAGFDPETEGQSIEVSGEPLTDLEDLDGSTTYEVYIITVCDEEDSVLIGPKSFTTLITPPENTRLCDAIMLEANAGCVGGPWTNVGAFEQVDEPSGSCLNNFHGTNSVWFSFVAPADGMATITTNFNSTNFNTEMVAFEAPEDCEDVSTLGEEIGCASTNENLVLEDLVPGAVYYVKVAGFNNAEGDFCIEVQMDDTPVVCEDPSNIEVTDVTEDEATVEWIANGSETQWEVAYGLAGFDLDTEGQTEVVDTNSIVLTDLVAETEYDVYVRALCNENLSSDWVGPENFTTEPMSVASEIFNDFSYYPNPVQEVLTLKATAQIEKVEVFNLLGQLVLKTQPNTLDAQLNTEQLQSGAYLMRVSIDGATKTFRIIKK